MKTTTKHSPNITKVNTCDNWKRTITYKDDRKTS